MSASLTPRQSSSPESLADVSFSGRGSGPIITERVEELLNALSANSALRVDRSYNQHGRLPEDLAKRMIERIRGDYFRPQGLELYSPRERLDGQGWKSLLEWHKIDQSSKAGLYNLEDAVSKIEKELKIAKIMGDPYKVYRVTNALQHAVQLDVGWIDTADISWLICEKLCPGEKDNDYAYFTALDPVALIPYAPPDEGFYGNGRKVLEALGVDFSDPLIADLNKKSLLLEIDLRVYREQIPFAMESTPFVSIRDWSLDSNGSTFEIITPLPPSDLGPHGCKVLASIIHA
jgi:hypothetical protein